MALVLAVDDEDDILEIIRVNLELEGHRVVLARNGHEAIDQAKLEHPDLVLLDVMMPGMDGVTFLQILRQAKKHQKMPVVLVTALDVTDVERRTRAFGVLEILPKTQRLLDDLMKTVQRIVGHTAAPGAHPSGVHPQEN